MARTQVKICGITRIEDGISAVRMGADAIGLVFYPPSPRAVGRKRAAEIATAMPPFTKVVGLFVNAAPDTIRTTLETVRLDLIQFHGDETPRDCEQFQVPYVKALAMRPGVDALAEAARFGTASGLLLDAWNRQLRGGSGVSFDWSLVPWISVYLSSWRVDWTRPTWRRRFNRCVRLRWMSAGGSRRARGIKDEAKMAAFLEEVSGA